MHARPAALLALWGVLWGSPALAQEEAPGPTYVDFAQGPLVNSGRVIGLGGAFAGIAEGADGHLVNPASFASRYSYTLDQWYDWDLALSWLNDFGRDDNQLDLSGVEDRHDSVSFLQLGFALRFGRLGVGFHVQSQTYELTVGDPSDRQAFTYSQTYGGLGLAYAFWDGELLVGALLASGNSMLSRDEAQEGQLGELAHTGGGLALGALWAPYESRYRFGATLKTAIEGFLDTQDDAAPPEEAEVPDVCTSRTLFSPTCAPEALLVPWELTLGGSWMGGQRVYNPRPTYGEGIPPAGDRGWGREYWLVSSDLVLTGPANYDAISTSAYVNGSQEPSGQDATLSIRLGVESEVWSDLLVLRTGTYSEPSRAAEGGARWHWTGGFDAHILSLWWEWRLSFTWDLAKQYGNFGVGLGVWH
jgi:hypothetical protein